MILGCCPQQRHSTNINVLYGIFNSHIWLGNGVDEGIEIANHNANVFEVLLCKVSLVGFS